MPDSSNISVASHTPHSEELELGKLYALLTESGDYGSRNWAFFVPDPKVSPIGATGTIFHVADQEGSIGSWKLVIEDLDVFSFPTAIAIIRLADIRVLGEYEDIIDNLSLMLRIVSIPTIAEVGVDFSSKSWFLDAICALDDCCVLQCDDIGLLEKEIKRCAFSAFHKYSWREGWRIYVLPISRELDHSQETFKSPEASDIALPQRELESEKLYAVLTYRGELGLWNWSFFVPDPSVFPIGSAGTIFHVVDSDLVGLWKFEAKKEGVISSSPLVVAITRLADISALGEYNDIVGKDTLLSMLKTVPIPTHASTDFSSQVWFMEAIRVLHDFGVVHCDYSDLLKREIKRLGFDAMANYLENKGRIGLHISF